MRLKVFVFIFICWKSTEWKIMSKVIAKKLFSPRCKEQLHFSSHYIEKQLWEASLNPWLLHNKWKSIKLYKAQKFWCCIISHPSPITILLAYRLFEGKTRRKKNIKERNFKFFLKKKHKKFEQFKKNIFF